jgi:hypothetical protein
MSDSTRPFRCDNGAVYLMPEKHCVFCEHCTDLLFDYTNGPYMFFCEICDAVDYTQCGKFKKKEAQHE